MQLRGFNELGAAAAMHSATADGFKVSGVFRDPADFAVLILFDADNFYEHPRLKYLPDFNFAGLTLTFDVHYNGLMPLDSPKYATIDWPYLDVIRADGTSTRIRLMDHAVAAGGANTAAQGEFTIIDEGLKQYDRVTLWYLNFAFDYIVPRNECAYAFFAQGTGTYHYVNVAGVDYGCFEQAGDTNTDIATHLAEALAPCPELTVTQGDGAPGNPPPNQLDLRARRDDGLAFLVSSSASADVYELYGIGPNTVAQALAGQINNVDWGAYGVILPLSAQVNGSQILVSTVPGYDGNMISMYAVSPSERLRADPSDLPFSGGTSDTTWRITLDFEALGVPQIHKMWLTFAPPLAKGAALQPVEWEAAFTNWTLSGPEETKRLRVAAAGSLRIEEDDPWCRYEGDWLPEAGFFSRAYARRASSPDQTVTVTYTCPATHDLYLGTSLYVDRGIAAIQVDGDAETMLDCYLSSDSAVITRRLARAGIPPGRHTVRIRPSGTKNADSANYYLYFDFVEAAVPGDVPAPLPDRSDISPALDYSTDHTYKLPPSRLLWSFDELGFAGPMNEYIGVFWWNQRVQASAVFSTATVHFEGEFNPGDQIFIDIGGTLCGKTVFPAETNDLFARHFEYFINATYVGVWAKAEENRLTITCRSTKPAYQYSLNVWKDSPTGSSGNVYSEGSLDQGVEGQWQVDPALMPPLNRAARDWHADFFRECATRGRELTVATSMELVNPPEEFAARYPDGAPVRTGVGFGGLSSTHCSFVPARAAFQNEVCKHLADLMAGAGLIPDLQFGEYVWWYFSSWAPDHPAGGMAYYDPETQAAAEAALGRPLHVFISPDDDPQVNGGADAMFLRGRLRDHVWELADFVRQFHANARFETLFPYDVNHPTPAGAHNLGGRLNRFVNFPAEWEQKESSGLNRIKMEALDFGAYSRNLNLTREALEFPLLLGWPHDSVRYLVPVFKGGFPWEREYRRAIGRGLPAVNLWAFDHVCLFGLPIPPETRGRAHYFNT